LSDYGHKVPDRQGFFKFSPGMRTLINSASVNMTPLSGIKAPDRGFYISFMGV
jgi:hypothetical protein